MPEQESQFKETSADHVKTIDEWNKEGRVPVYEEKIEDHPGHSPTLVSHRAHGVIEIPEIHQKEIIIHNPEEEEEIKKAA